MRRSLRALAAATCLVALAACGDDDENSSDTTEASADDTVADSVDDTAGEETDGGEADVSLPEGMTLPEGLSEECVEFAQEWAGAIGGAAIGDKASLETLDEAIAALSENAPEDLHDDLEILGETLGAWGEFLAEHDYNIADVATDPEAQEVLQELSTPEFQEASENVTAWLQEECAPS